jgi:hypothetical protein
MKKLLPLAFILYITGIAGIADWIIFCERNNDLYDDFIDLKAKYINRFPDFTKPFFSLNPQPAAIFFTLGFIMAGIIFIKQNQRIYKILAITSFLFGAWNLFSIM